MANFNLERRKECMQNLEIIQDLIDACSGVNQDVTHEEEMLFKAQELLKKNEYTEIENMIKKMNEVLRHKTKVSIIRESVFALSKFRSYSEIAKKLEILDEENEKILDSLVGERVLAFSLEDWRAMFTKCNEGILAVGNALEETCRQKIDEISDAIQMGGDLEMDMMDVDVLLELAQVELDRNEYLACYDFLSQAMAVNQNVLQIFIRYAQAIKKAREKISEYKAKDEKIDISQLEHLISLSQVTAKGGDYSGAFDIATSLSNHLAKLDSSSIARKKISDLRLWLLDLKDICPDHLVKRKIFSTLDLGIFNAKVEYNNEEYQNAIDITSNITDEVEKVDRHVRREYCISLLKKCKSLMREPDFESTSEPKVTIQLQEILDYASELFNDDRYREASMKAEQCYEKIRSILKNEGKKFCDEQSEKIERLLKNIRTHKLDTPELDDMYQEYQKHSEERDYIKCTPLIREIKEKVHVRYRNFINRKLENIKDIVEVAASLGDEIDEITSGLIIVQENFDSRNYEKSLEILDKVTEKVEAKHDEALSMKEDLKKRLNKAGDALAEMTRRGEDVEGLFKAMEKIEDLLENGDFVKARRVADKLDAAIYGIIDNLFLSIDVLKGEIEEMGVEGSGLFDNLIIGRRALAREQYFLAYTLANDIKSAIKDLEKRLSETPTEDLTAGGEMSHGILTIPKEPAEEIPKGEALVTVGRIEEDGVLKKTEELLDISKDLRNIEMAKIPLAGEETTYGRLPFGMGAASQDSIEAQGGEKPDIVGMATKAKELLDILTKRGVGISFLEREVEQAMAYVEKDDWNMAHKHLQSCIDRAVDLVVKESEEGVTADIMMERIRTAYGELSMHTSHGIDLGEAEGKLDLATSSAESGDLSDATAFLEEAKKIIEEHVSLYNKLVVKISRIQAKLSELVRDNVEIGIVHSLFDNIKNLTRKGQYSKALDVCEQCQDELSRRESYVQRQRSAVHPWITRNEYPDDSSIESNFSSFSGYSSADDTVIKCSNCGRSLDRPKNPFYTTVHCPECHTENPV